MRLITLQPSDADLRRSQAMSSSIALPGAATPLHFSSMPSSSTRISHFTATITVLTLPTHFEVPLLQLDTTRKLERATPLQPSTYALSNSATQSGKGGRATAPFIRVQFRNSTANHPSGATSVGGMTPRFAMRVVVDAILVEGGRKVEVGRWESDELCVRGRSPKNFGVVTAKGREMAAAKGSSAAVGAGKAPKEKSKAKAKGKGKGKAGKGKGAMSPPSDEEEEQEDGEDELDAEDEYLANIAAQKAASALAAAAASTSTVPSKRDIEITWDDYEEESLTVAKRTRSSSRR